MTFPTPNPSTDPGVLGSLVVQCILDGLALNDNAQGYDLEADSRSEQQVTFRKQEVTSPFVDGTYQISAVRENVTENVNVWVVGRSPADLDRRVQALLTRLEKPRFTTLWAYQQFYEEWTCMSAQYTVRTQREYQHALRALVRAQIPRLPRVTRRYSDVVGQPEQVVVR